MNNVPGRGQKTCIKNTIFSLKVRENFLLEINV